MMALQVGSSAYVTTQTIAQSCVAPVDSNQGYPKAGVEIGAGVHVKDSGGGPFVTQTYAAPLQSFATALQWGYPADAVTTPVLTPLATSLGLPAPTALTAAFFPPNVAP
jgi:hypothetical protein